MTQAFERFTIKANKDSRLITIRHMEFNRLWRVVTVLTAALGSAAFAQSANPSAGAAFDKDVAPIFKSNCAGCHGDSVKMKDLNLNTEATALKGSESGPVIVPGKPDESILFKKVRDGSMPVGKPHLSDQQIETISSWIKGAAPDPSKAEKVDDSPLTQNDVVPILLTRCVVCHGLRKQEGGLDLRSKASMLKGGGKSGRRSSSGSRKKAC